MNTAYNPNDPAHLRERADALEAQMNGKPLQYLHHTGQWVDRARKEPSLLEPLNRYRPKPWTLPEPPAGMRWTNPELWTEEMLPTGRRPRLVGEIGEYEYSVNLGRDWAQGAFPEIACQDSPMRLERTTRPLPSLMPGPEYHNPAGVSLAQVGEGYRLLTKEEQAKCKMLSRVHKGMSVWRDDNTWSDADTSGMCEECTYRVPLNWQPSKPAPQPEPRLWDCAEDVPLVCWMRKRAVQPKSYGKLVVHVIDYGVFLYDEYAGWASMEDYEYSTDRQHWQPCHKATEAQS